MRARRPVLMGCAPPLPLNQLNMMTETLKTAAIIVAAGRGLRAGSGGPKQYRSIAGRTVISRAMEPFCGHPDVFAVQPVLNPDDTVMFNEAVAELQYQPPTAGGATRQASVHAGLEALPVRSSPRP
jgi:2-C-methyl-D-erythritol 4-phosphate cytidylyltransferase/2-C-methyl-D-erythritol 2,4-cyclodiphosphate synthase